MTLVAGGASKAHAVSDVGHPSGSYGMKMPAFQKMLYICWRALCHNVHLVISQPSGTLAAALSCFQLIADSCVINV